MRRRRRPHARSSRFGSRRTLDKHTARFDLTMEVKEPQTGRAVTFTGKGAYNDSQQAVEMTFDFPNVGADAPGSMEFRMLCPVTYMHFDGLPAGEQLPNGKSWVKIDLQRQLQKLGV
jgi:hypothetical protein